MRGRGPAPMKTLREEKASAPKIDCFYVYPTASADPSSNSDLVPGTKSHEEIPTVQEQFARFGSACRLFAPMYRSSTVAAMLGRVPPADRKLAYGDVEAAWRHYLAHDNHGRGVILIGHSQGAFVLRRLLREDVDGQPLQAQLVSAMLIGGNVETADGSDVGGDFQHIPLCRHGDQISCVIAWSSFRGTTPPPADTRFGRSKTAGRAIGCTNPAALAGGEAALKPYFPSAYPLAPGEPPQLPWTRSGAVTTPLVTAPSFVYGECRPDAHGSYLAISVRPRAGDDRVSDIKGDIMVGARVLPEWGLHIVDMDVAVGDLVTLAQTQGGQVAAAASIGCSWFRSGEPDVR